MFKLLDEPTFDWRVDVRVPAGPDPATGENRVEVQSFIATFATATIEEIAAARGENAQLLTKVWRGWRDVADAEGKPIAFDEEVKARMLAQSNIRIAVWTAFMEGITGDEARRGN